MDDLKYTGVFVSQLFQRKYYDDLNSLVDYSMTLRKVSSLVAFLYSFNREECQIARSQT